MGKRLSSIEERALANRLSGEGFGGQDINTAIATLRRRPEMLNSFISQLPQQSSANPYKDVATASDTREISWAEEFGAGFTNSAVSFGAGVRQLAALNDHDQLNSIREWQKSSEIQLTNATKRALSANEFNSTQFWFNSGNAIGSAVTSYGAAAVAALSGAGLPASIALTAMASYPQVYNSLLNSALDAGYSADDAVKYAHLTALPISAIEIFPAAKFGKMLGGKVVSEIAQEASAKLLPKFARTQTAEALATELTQQAGKQLNPNLLFDVYKNTKNSIIDNLLVKGGKVLEQGLTEGLEEVAQNYLQKYAEYKFDSANNTSKFGTTLANIGSQEQFFEAMKDGFYGFIAGGGMGMASFAKPLYEQGVYNTLALSDKRGKLESGVQSITNQIQQKLSAGTISEEQATAASTVLNDVYATYKKLGSEVKDPTVRYTLFRGIQTKNALSAELTQLETQKADTEAKIASGELDETLAATGIERIDNMIARRNEQYLFTSEWLKQTSNQYFQNQTNAAKAKVANLDVNIDNFAESARITAESKNTFYDKLVGNNPDFSSLAGTDFSAGLNEIDKKYNEQLGIIEYNQVKDSELEDDFDIFEEAEKTLKNADGSYTKARFVHDGNGNYARQVFGDSGQTGYVRVPGTSFYQQRLSEIFGANGKFDTIAEKMLNNDPLTAEQAQVYDDFTADIENLYQEKKSTDRAAVDLLVRDSLGMLNAQQTDSLYNTTESPVFSERQQIDAGKILSSMELYEKDYNKITDNKKLDQDQKVELIAGLLKQYPELAPYADTLIEQIEGKKTNSVDKKKQSSVRKEADRVSKIRQADKELAESQIDIEPNGTSNSEDVQPEVSPVNQQPAVTGTVRPEIVESLVQSTGVVRRRSAKQKSTAGKGDTTNKPLLDELAETERALEQIYQQIAELPEQEPGNENSAGNTAESAEIAGGYPASFNDQALKSLLENEVVFEKVKQLIPSLDYITSRSQMLEEINNSEENEAIVARNWDTLVELNRPKQQLQLRVQRRERGEGDYKKGYFPLGAINMATLADGTEVEFTINSVVDDRINISERPRGIEDDSAEQMLDLPIDEFKARYNEKKFKQINPRSYGQAQKGNNSEPYIDNGVIKNDKVYYVDQAYNASQKLPSNTLSRVQVVAMGDSLYGIKSTRWKQPRQVSREEIVSSKELMEDLQRPESERLYANKNNKHQLYQLGDRDVQNVKALVDSLDKVFKIQTEILNGEEWIENGYDPSANGFFDRANGVIYINADRADTSTVVHENGHVAVEIIRQQFPELFARMSQLIKGTIYEEMVRESYPDLIEEDIAHESLAWAIQDNGMMLLNESPTLLAKFQELIKRMWKRITEALGLPKSIDNIQNLTLDEFSKEVARKILSGNEFDSIFGMPVKNEFEPLTGIFYQKLPGDNYVRTAAEDSRLVYAPAEIKDLKNTLDELVGKSEMAIRNFINNQIGAIYNNPYWRSKIGVRAINRFTAPNIDELARQLSNGGIPSIKDFMAQLRGAWDYDNKMLAAQSPEAKALVSQQFRAYVDVQLAQQKQYVQLYADLGVTLDDYAAEAKAKHSTIIENGKKSYAYVDGKYQAKNAQDNIDKLLKGNKTRFQKALMKVISNEFFNKFFNFSSVANFLGGDSGVLRGIYDLQIFQNLQAATWEKQAQADRALLAQKMDELKSLRNSKEDILVQKFDFTFLDNMDPAGVPALTTQKFTLGMLLKMYQQYYTQTNYGRHKKGVAEWQKYSDLYFDGAAYPALVAKGDGKPLRRGYEVEIDGRVYNILLNDTHLQELNNLFGTGGAYNDVFELFRQFYNKTGRFKSINDTFVALNSEDLEELRGTKLQGLTQQEIDDANAGYYFPTRSNTIDTVGRRDIGSNVEDIRYLKQRSNLYGALYAGDGEALRDVDNYINESVKYIRNGEVRQSLSVYLAEILPNINKNDRELTYKLNWIRDFIKDLDSYDSRSRDSGLNKDFLGIPYVSYNSLMSNFASSVFCFNLGNPLKQATGQFAAFGNGYIENKYLLASQKYFIPALIGSYKGLIAPEGKIFGQIDGGKLFDFSKTDDWTTEIYNNDYASDLYMRIADLEANTGGVDLYEYQKALRMGQNNERTQAALQLIGDARRKVNKYGLAAMHRSDRAVIISFYAAAKAQVKDEIAAGTLLDEAGNVVTDIDSDYAKMKIAQLATQVTYMTNNMYMINDKTAMQRDLNVWSRAIGLFSSQPQKIANLFMQNLFNAARVDFSDANLNKKLSGSINYAIIAGAVMNASVTIMYGILKHGFDDEEDYAGTFVAETTRNMIGIFPSFPTEIVSAAISAVDNKSWTSGIAENAVFENMNKLVNALNAYHESTDETASDYYRNKSFNTAVYSGVDGLSKLLGFPNVFSGKLSEQFKVEVDAKAQ